MFNRRAIASHRPATPMPGPASNVGAVTGWAPFGAGQHPSEQIGAFAGQRLNQFPAYIPGVQLHSGREWGRSNWYYPTVSYVPNGSVQITQQQANLPGSQRWAAQFSGPVGPVNAQQNRFQVAAAQIAQSGMQAYTWAQNLVPQQAAPLIGS